MPWRDLIRFVYQVQDFQLEGVPACAANEHVDIVAKAAAGPRESRHDVRELRRDRRQQ